jgi:hypothetical protein
MNNRNNYFIPEYQIKRFRWGDSIIIAVMLIATVFSLRLFSTVGSSSTVLIYRDNTVIAQYPLSEEREVSVSGKRGTVDVCIKGSSVVISKSTCDHQICVRSGAITNKYGQLVCAPNHILICIRSGRNNQTDIDAIAR